MAAKRLAAMFEAKEQEANQLNNQNKVTKSAASKPIVHKAPPTNDKDKNIDSNNSPYYLRILDHQQKKQSQDNKSQPLHMQNDDKPKPNKSTANPLGVAQNIDNSDNAPKTNAALEAERMKKFEEETRKKMEEDKRKQKQIEEEAAKQQQNQTLSLIEQQRRKFEQMASNNSNKDNEAAERLKQQREKQEKAQKEREEMERKLKAQREKEAAIQKEKEMAAKAAKEKEEKEKADQAAKEKEERERKEKAEKEKWLEQQKSKQEERDKKLQESMNRKEPKDDSQENGLIKSIFKNASENESYGDVNIDTNPTLFGKKSASAPSPKSAADKSPSPSPSPSAKSVTFDKNLDVGSGGGGKRNSDKKYDGNKNQILKRRNLSTLSAKEVEKKEKNKEQLHRKNVSNPNVSDKKTKKHLEEIKNARNLDTSQLLHDPALRKKVKELKNFSGGGFKIHVNHRYILDDGRIGVCRFKGRTAFGKSSEDWVGIVVEYGEGKHNGTVNGKTYFRCREGQGAMVQTHRILIDVGHSNKGQIDAAMKRKAKELSEAYAEMQEEKRKQNAKKKKRQKSWQMDDEYGGWKPPQWDDFKVDQSDKLFTQKLHYSKSLLDKNKGKKADKKKHHTQI